MSSKYLKSLTESQALSLRLGQWNRLDCCWSYLLIAINISKLNAKIYELTKYTGCHKKWGNVFWAHFEGVNVLKSTGLATVQTKSKIILSTTFWFSTPSKWAQKLSPHFSDTLYFLIICSNKGFWKLFAS